MIAHRLLAEGQTVRNFVVIITLADERQHLMFPFGQFGEETLGCIGAHVGKEGRQLARNGRAKERFSFGGDGA